MVGDDADDGSVKDPGKQNTAVPTASTGEGSQNLSQTGQNTSTKEQKDVEPSAGTARKSSVSVPPGIPLSSKANAGKGKETEPSIGAEVSALDASISKILNEDVNSDTSALIGSIIGDDSGKGSPSTNPLGLGEEIPDLGSIQGLLGSNTVDFDSLLNTSFSKTSPLRSPTQTGATPALGAGPSARGPSTSSTSSTVGKDGAPPPSPLRRKTMSSMPSSMRSATDVTAPKADAAQTVPSVAKKPTAADEFKIPSFGETSASASNQGSSTGIVLDSPGRISISTDDLTKLDLQQLGRSSGLMSVTGDIMAGFGDATAGAAPVRKDDMLSTDLNLDMDFGLGDVNMEGLDIPDIGADDFEAAMAGFGDVGSMSPIMGGTVPSTMQKLTPEEMELDTILQNAARLEQRLHHIKKQLRRHQYEYLHAHLCTQMMRYVHAHRAELPAPVPGTRYPNLFTPDGVKILPDPARKLTKRMQKWQHELIRDIDEEATDVSDPESEAENIEAEQRMKQSIPLSHRRQWNYSRRQLAWRWTWLERSIQHLDKRIAHYDTKYREIRMEKANFQTLERVDRTFEAESDLQKGDVSARTLLWRFRKRGSRKTYRHRRLIAMQFEPQLTEAAHLNEKAAQIDDHYHPIFSMPLDLPNYCVRYAPRVQRSSSGLRSAHGAARKWTADQVKAMADKSRRAAAAKGAADAAASGKKKASVKKMATVTLTGKRKATGDHTGGANVPGSPGRKRADSESGSQKDQRSAPTTPGATTPGETASHKSEEKKRRRSTAYEMDNIILPSQVSGIAANRIDKIDYKDIETPHWREVNPSKAAVTVPATAADAAAVNAAEKTEEKGPEEKKAEEKKVDEKKPEEKKASSTGVTPRRSMRHSAQGHTEEEDSKHEPPATEKGGASADADANKERQVPTSVSDEEMSDEAYLQRHLKLETAEKKRHQQFVQAIAAPSPGRSRAASETGASTDGGAGVANSGHVSNGATTPVSPNTPRSPGRRRRSSTARSDDEGAGEPVEHTNAEDAMNGIADAGDKDTVTLESSGFAPRVFKSRKLLVQHEIARAKESLAQGANSGQNGDRSSTNSKSLPNGTATTATTTKKE
eukprot:Clim_evm9s154 gene=Clim_evmTU9s154